MRKVTLHSFSTRTPFSKAKDVCRAVVPSAGAGDGTVEYLAVRAAWQARLTVRVRAIQDAVEVKVECLSSELMAPLARWRALSFRRLLRRSLRAEELREPPSETLVFVSYRRADSLVVTGRMCDALSRRYGRAVFMDLDGISAGADFTNRVETAISQSQVFLCVIGDGWLNAEDETGQRRLDNPNDFVRRELELAFQRNLLVIPILVNGAKMPDRLTLPPTLQQLTLRNARPVRNDPDFDRDIETLTQDLDREALQHTAVTVADLPKWPVTLLACIIISMVLLLAIRLREPTCDVFLETSLPRFDRVMTACRRQGFEPVALVGFASQTTTELKMWWRRATVARRWVVLPDTSLGEFSRQVSALRREGVQPVSVNVITGGALQPRVSAVFVVDSDFHDVFIDDEWATFEGRREEMRRTGKMPLAYTLYGAGDRVLVTSIWQSNKHGLEWRVTPLLGADAYQRHFDESSLVHQSPQFATIRCVQGSYWYSGVFVDKNPDSVWAFNDVTLGELQALLASKKTEGYQPRSVQGCQGLPHVKYAGILVRE